MTPIYDKTLEKVAMLQRVTAVVLPLTALIFSIWGWRIDALKGWSASAVTAAALYLANFLWKRSFDRPARFGVIAVDEQSDPHDKFGDDLASLYWAAAMFIAMAISPWLWPTG